MLQGQPSDSVASDVRVYSVDVTAVPETVTVDLEFNTPAGMPVTQDIPIVNRSQQNWKIQARLAPVLCSSDNRGGMKRRDEEIRKQPSGDPSSGGIPALQQNPGIFTSTPVLHQQNPGIYTSSGISARLFPYLLISSFHSTPVI